MALQQAEPSTMVPIEPTRAYVGCLLKKRYKPNTLDTSQSWGFIWSIVWLRISWALTTHGATSHTGGGGNMKLMLSVLLRRLKGHSHFEYLNSQGSFPGLLGAGVGVAGYRLHLSQWYYGRP